MSQIAVDTYGSKYVHMNRVSDDVKPLRELIKNVATDNEFVKFIGEFTSVTGHACIHSHTEETNTLSSSDHLHSSDGVVKVPGKHMTHKHMSVLQHTPFTVRGMEQLMTAIEGSIPNALSLTLPSANEILVFVLADTDRSSHGEFPHSVPIGYAMKGTSLTTAAFRNMVMEILRACSNKGIYVPCTSYDGQWWQIAVRDAEGNPVTLIELMRDVGNEARRTPKAELVRLLLRKIDEGSIDMQAIREYISCDVPNPADSLPNSSEAEDAVLLPPDILNTIDPSVVDALHEVNTETCHERENAQYLKDVGLSQFDPLENVPDVMDDHKMSLTLFNEDTETDDMTVNHRVMSSHTVDEGVTDKILSNDSDGTAEFQTMQLSNEEYDSQCPSKPAIENQLYNINHDTHLLDKQDFTQMIDSCRRAKGKNIVRDAEELCEMIENSSLHTILNKEQMKALLRPIQTKLQRNGIAVNPNWKKQKLLDIFRTAYWLEPTGTNLDSNTPSKTAAQELNEMKKISLNYVYSKVTYESKMREFKEASIIHDNIPVNINGVARESCE